MKKHKLNPFNLPGQINIPFKFDDSNAKFVIKS